MFVCMYLQYLGWDIGVRVPHIVFIKIPKWNQVVSSYKVTENKISSIKLRLYKLRTPDLIHIMKMVWHGKTARRNITIQVKQEYQIINIYIRNTKKGTISRARSTSNLLTVFMKGCVNLTEVHHIKLTKIHNFFHAMLVYLRQWWRVLLVGWPGLY